METVGIHGLSKTLLLSPEAQVVLKKQMGLENDAMALKKLGKRGKGTKSDDAGSLLSDVVRKERALSFARITKATQAYVDKAQQRLLELTFSDANELGFALEIVSSKDQRDRLRVKATTASCPATLGVSDELVAINRKLIVEPSRETFAAVLEMILAPLERSENVTLTFLRGNDDNSPIVQREHDSNLRQIMAPTSPLASPKRHTTLTFQKGSLSSVAFSKPETKKTHFPPADEEEVCSCFDRSLLRGACHTRGMDVDGEAILKENARTKGKKCATHLMIGDVVRLKKNIVPRLGWYGLSGNFASHFSVGVVTHLDRDNYTFVLATICISKRMTHWRAHAEDFDVIDKIDRTEDANSFQKRRDTISASCELERHSSLRQRPSSNCAYIFMAHPDQETFDTGRPLLREAIEALTEDERLSRSKVPRRPGSTHNIAQKKPPPPPPPPTKKKTFLEETFPASTAAARTSLLPAIEAILGKEDGSPSLLMSQGSDSSRSVLGELIVEPPSEEVGDSFGGVISAIDPDDENVSMSDSYEHRRTQSIVEAASSEDATSISL